MQSRRSFIQLASSASVTAALAGRRAFAQEAGAGVAPLTLDEIIEQELIQSEVEPTIDPITGEIATYREANWEERRRKKSPLLRLTIADVKADYEANGADAVSTWPADEDSIDYAHLLELGARGRLSTASFRLTHDGLTRLAGANGYLEAIAGQCKIVLGLRGCRMLEPSVDSNGRLRPPVLIESTPDNLTMQCLIAVWDRAMKTVHVFNGSTVPNRIQVELYVLYNEYKACREVRGTDGSCPEIVNPGEWKTNLLPQGLYHYQVGTHLGSRARDRQHSGALRQVSVCPVLRAASRPAFTYREFWDTPNGPVFDNVHASVYDHQFPYFSSQGCQTVSGGYNPRGQTAFGEWAAFQKALGLSSPDPITNRTLQDGQDVFYLLTTGREARIHAEADPNISPEALYRVRYGSRGPRAESVQQLLIDTGHLLGQADGVFGNASARGLLSLQQNNTRMRTDGVFSATDAQGRLMAGW